MLNGCQNVGDAATGWYYDHERFLPFRERTEALGVPVYLHPRDPCRETRESTRGTPNARRLFPGLPERIGSPADTARA